MNVIQIVHLELLNTIERVFSPGAVALENINVVLNTDASKQQFGDLSANAALYLQKMQNKHLWQSRKLFEKPSSMLLSITLKLLAPAL